jgi:cell division protein FtsB
MATSEIFPIFQRTKRPTRPAGPAMQRAQRPSGSRPVVRSAMSDAEKSAGSSTGSSSGSSSGMARSPQRPGNVAQRSRLSSSGARAGSNAGSRPASRSGLALGQSSGLSSQQSSVAITPMSAPGPLAVRRAAAQTRNPSTRNASTRNASTRNAPPARGPQGDRPARRFLLRFGIAVLLVGIGVFALAFLGVLPARTYFGQQDELVQKKARLVMLGERNSLLGNRVASLQSDQVVARIARDQFGMVAPGDTLTVLPGLRDESLSLNGDASNVVTAIPPADVAGDPALLSSLLHWLRQIVG